MTWLIAAAAWLGLLQVPEPGVYHLTFSVPGREPMLVTLSVPPGYDGTQPRPLVLALHPGGTRFPYYGGAFMEEVVGPGLADLEPIIVAPDSPTEEWTDAATEQAVMELLDRVMTDYAVDRRQVLITGYSLGGRGAWFLSARHPDVVTGAIVMAGSIDGEITESLASVPTYVIHSRQDEVVPFEPIERAIRDLDRLDRPVRFHALEGPGHYDMSTYVDSLRSGGRWIADRWRD
jgi:predicted peptidase